MIWAWCAWCHRRTKPLPRVVSTVTVRLVSIVWPVACKWKYFWIISNQYSWNISNMEKMRKPVILITREFDELIPPENIIPRVVSTVLICYTRMTMDLNEQHASEWRANNINILWPNDPPHLEMKPFYHFPKDDGSCCLRFGS